MIVAIKGSSVASALAVVAYLVIGWGSLTSAQVGSLNDKATTTVWSGVYTVADAQRGKIAYAKTCERCHGANLKGSDAVPPIVGKPFFDRWHDLRLFDAFAYIQSAMPDDFRTFVPADEARDVLAFLLQQNGIPSGKQPLPKSYDGLNEIFITYPPPDN
jgi:cytochrome c